ncbi:MAG: hypothetical protein IJM38_02385 [Ruminococcus sp.]|nr:hypothetical protein [Ruminococcus sp.]
MAENEAKETKEFNARKWIIWTIIISVIIVVGTAIFLVVTYSKDNSGRSLIEYIEQGIVILLAVAGGCSSIISMINGKKNNEEQQKREDALRKEQCEREDRLLQQQKDFEEKWNQKKIDADLKARARIEWIQRVREATSSFYSSCNDLLKATSLVKENDEIDTNYIKELVLNARQMGAILILYFGPEANIDKERELDATDSNKGKNNKMVALIESILNSNENMKKNHDETNNKLKYYERKMDDLLPKIPYIDIEIPNPDEDMPSYYMEEDTASEEYIEYTNIEKRYNSILNSFSEKYNNQNDRLRKLIDAIRLYLKIEWDRAKNNED